MTLLQNAIEEQVQRQLGSKFTLTLYKDRLDPQLLKVVGKLLGTSSPGTTVKECFLAAACLFSSPDRGISDVRLDDMEKVFSVLGANIKGRKGRGEQLRVSVLRWSIVLASPKMLEVSDKATTPEQMVTYLMEAFKRAVTDLLSFQNRRDKL